MRARGGRLLAVSTWPNAMNMEMRDGNVMVKNGGIEITGTILM